MIFLIYKDEFFFILKTKLSHFEKNEVIHLKILCLSFFNTTERIRDNLKLLIKQSNVDIYIDSHA